jgi:hypothetical protein
MTHTRQPELFARESAATLLAAVCARLPNSELVSVSDVATACNVSVTLVYTWIEEGLVHAVNLGSESKTYWKVFRPSVVDFWTRRLAGQ